jgi:GNAT superfamily N-acetyltransferase
MTDVRPLTRGELERVAARLPLHRFADWRDDSTYLVAWDGEEPVGHAHIAWFGTELGIPELQDFFVPESHRGRGIGTVLARAAETLVASRGHERASLGVSASNPAARRLYERLGYVRADVPPKRVTGTVAVRGGPLEVDDTLLYFEKRVVDFSPARSF